MSETDHRTEPHVSTEELRAALTPRGETRRNPVLVTEQAEHAEGEIPELRDALEAERAGKTELNTELDLSRSGVQWVINGYILALAAGFALGGRLADVLGSKRVVLIGIIGFANRAFPAEALEERCSVELRLLEG